MNLFAHEELLWQKQNVLLFTSGCWIHNYQSPAIDNTAMIYYFYNLFVKLHFTTNNRL